MNLDQLKAALTSKGIEFEVQNRTVGTYIGIKTGNFMFTWFMSYNAEAEDCYWMFDHSYCQNRGKKHKGVTHRFKKIDWIQKKLGATINPTV